jgi:hypothetical protein
MLATAALIERVTCQRISKASLAAFHAKQRKAHVPVNHLSNEEVEKIFIKEALLHMQSQYI